MSDQIISEVKEMPKKLPCQKDAANSKGYVVTYQFSTKSKPVEINEAADIEKIINQRFGKKNPRRNFEMLKKHMIMFDDFLKKQIMECPTKCKSAAVCVKSKKLLDLAGQTIVIMEKYHFTPAA